MPRVLFIAGDGRSGSTIVHNVLSQIEGLVGVGELRDVWGRGALKNVTCGCGKPFRGCPFWNDVMDRAFGGLGLERARRMLALAESVRTRDLLLYAAPGGRRRELRRLTEYLAGLSRLYGAIEEVSGCGVIVDSSKNPSYGYLLRHVEGVDLHVVHVVRDALAVAYAWQKHVETEPGFTMPQKSAARSALGWMARNAASELFLRQGPSAWTFMRYEDFVRRPRAAVSLLLEQAGLSTAGTPFVSSRDVDLRRPSHSVSGNPVRFLRGIIRISIDEQWRDALPTRDRHVVSALTWPFRARYGYLSRRLSIPGMV